MKKKKMRRKNIAFLCLSLSSLPPPLALSLSSRSLSSNQQFDLSSSDLCYKKKNVPTRKFPPPPPYNYAGRNLLAALIAATRALSSSNLDRSSASSSLLASRDRNL